MQESRDHLLLYLQLLIKSNYNYNSKNWNIDILSKRIIAWISNSKLTYENAEANYKIRFNLLIKKLYELL